MTAILEGLHVLDFSSLLAGPFATQYMSDMGADVLRVVSGTRSDYLLTAPPFLQNGRISAADAQLNRNKRCMTLNLKDSRGQEIIRQLAGEYDIIIESFRPGIMAKFNLAYENLKKVNPAVIYCSLSGYGQTGKMKSRAGHDINFMARSGIASYTGKKETGPCLSGLQTDLASGSYNAVIGILAAVIYRNTTGKGQHIDISMNDGTIALTALYGAAALVDGEDPELEGLPYNGQSLYDYYKTKDGKYVGFGGIETKFFTNFCNTIQHPDLIEGGILPDNVDKVKKEVSRILLTKTRDEWVALFEQAEACIDPVMTLTEALNDPLVKEREMVVEVPLEGGGSLKQLGNPIKFSDTIHAYKKPGFAIQPGNHTKDVCLQLGYSEKEIEDFEKTGLFS